MTSRLLQPFKLLGQLALVLLALGILPSASSNEGGPTRLRFAAAADNALEARVIVKYKTDSTLMRALSATDPKGAQPRHAAALSQRLGLALANGRVLGIRTQGLRATGLSSSALVARLAAQPDVEWAVIDERRYINALTNDPLLAGAQAPPVTPTVGQWYLRAPDSTAVSAINAVGAWDVTTGSPGLTVAVLDTGVRLDHPDLIGKLHPGYDFVHDASTGSDGDGRDADASDPGDWSAANDCPGEPASDSSWHGTQVAGLIGAATNNGFGMAGVARNVMLLPVRVLGRCGGYDSDIIAAMRWAAGVTSDVGFGSSVTFTNSHPAKVINMSLGSAGACQPSYRDVIAEVNAVGVSVVVSAGNGVGTAVDTPANCPGAIAVAGVRHVGTKVGYSSLGPEVAIAAPAGNCVNLSGPCLYPLLTTVNTGPTTPLASAFTDSSKPSLGTSFSAPLVAGTVALMLSHNAALTVAGVKAVLQSSARMFPTSGGDAAAAACQAPNAVQQVECYCTTSTCGAGLLNAAAAVTRAFDPTVAISISPDSPTVGAAVTQYFPIQV